MLAALAYEAHANESAVKDASLSRTQIKQNICLIGKYMCKHKMTPSIKFESLDNCKAPAVK